VKIAILAVNRAFNQEVMSIKQDLGVARPHLPSSPTPQPERLGELLPLSELKPND